jgi:hypothetical protein
MAVLTRNSDLNVVAQDDRNVICAVAQWQPQPVVDQIAARIAQDSCGRLAGCSCLIDGGKPVTVMFAPAQLIKRAAGYFSMVVFNDSCTSEPYSALSHWLFDVDQCH